MALDSRRLGDAMLDVWNMFPADKKTVNKLGDRIYDLVQTIKMTQESDPNGDLGRERARQTAKAILDEIFNTAGNTTRYRFRNLAQAIINEFRLEAEIKPLDVTVPVGGSPPHTHTPTQTVKGKAKIL